MRVRLIAPSDITGTFGVEAYTSSCRYCPGGPDSDFEYSTQSYTGYEVSSGSR